MKKIAPVLFICIAFTACNQGNTDKPANTDTVQMAVHNTDSASVKTDTHYFWGADTDDKTGKMRMKKLRPISKDSLTGDALAGYMNAQYPKVQIEFVKISGDTVFVKIPKSNYLTQQMGSSGAEMYMTEATYNLSELKNISYVNFNFREGDHASPGTYSKSDFVNEK